MEVTFCRGKANTITAEDSRELNRMWESFRDNEAQRFACQLTTFFVAPWARGHGLAPMMLEEAEAFSKSEGFSMINLDVRSTQESAIRRYEGAGYVHFSTHPKYAFVNGEYVSGNYYYKEIG